MICDRALTAVTAVPGITSTLQSPIVTSIYTIFGDGEVSLSLLKAPK